MLGFGAVRDLLHAVESVLKEAAEPWPQEILDVLFQAAATLRQAVEAAGTEQQQSAFARAGSLLPRVVREPSAGGATAPPAATERAPPSAAGEDRPPAAAAADSEAEAAEPPPAVAQPDEAAMRGGELVRVPFEKLDGLLNDVARLTESVSELDALIGKHRDAFDAAGLRRSLQNVNAGIQRSATAIRQTTLDLRLVPVGRVFSRFPTLAREIARHEEKRVRVVLEGEETELDKSTVDALGEPLLHLVRNAVDHGIEPPDVREAKGKPPEGTLVLRAEQRGDEVRIEVEDDGTGLDRERILQRARERQLVPPDATLPPAAVAALIFRPGFSTRAEADAVSGRGIGMDVVHRVVQQRRGSLHVEDVPEGGTRFVVQLPLTLAVVPALIFEAASELLALPTAEVETTLRNPLRQAAGATEVIEHRGELLPLVDTGTLFGWVDGRPQQPQHPNREVFVLVGRRGNRAAALIADRLIEQRDIVVKALPGYLGQPRGVSGATVAPDGRVALLLDVVALFDLNLQTNRRDARGG